LSADCKANLVSVPILTKDSTGFYVAPSVALIQALQAYLTARKEVTQTVKVVSGERFLVYAVVAIRGQLLRGYSKETVTAAVKAAAESVLRDRSFGSWLYQSEIEDSLDAIDGFVSKNVEIRGSLTDPTDPNSLTTAKLYPTDPNIKSKNLKIDKGEIITRASDFPSSVPADSFYGLLVELTYYDA